MTKLDRSNSRWLPTVRNSTNVFETSFFPLTLSLLLSRSFSIYLTLSFSTYSTYHKTFVRFSLNNRRLSFAQRLSFTGERNLKLANVSLSPSTGCPRNKRRYKCAHFARGLGICTLFPFNQTTTRRVRNLIRFSASTS